MVLWNRIFWRICFQAVFRGRWVSTVKAETSKHVAKEKVAADASAGLGRYTNMIV